MKMEETMISSEKEDLTAQDGMILDHQLHEGKQLKKQLKHHHITTEELAQKLGVTRQALYLQMKRQYLSTRFKNRLSALGMYPFAAENNNTPKEQNIVGSVTEQVLLQEVKRLQTIIALQAEHIREMGKFI